MENPSLTVLVVDDNEMERLCLATMLRANGVMALEAPDGAVAINIMREREKDIAAVVSDIRMANIDGLRLAEWNFQNGYLPFIVCSIISSAPAALTLLKFGVRDYVSKPVTETVLMNTVRDAIGRRQLPRLFADDEIPLPGNMGAITISARLAEVHRASGWLGLKAAGLMTEAERRQFLAFASEFLMNAYEHGSLMLTEGEKAVLLRNGGYHDELRRRELECKTKIEVAASIVGNEIALNITDSGYGFNYKRYKEMSEAEIFDRLTMPNGRGIQMAMLYFDSITFNKGGAGVLLTKKIPKKMTDGEATGRKQYMILQWKDSYGVGVKAFDDDHKIYVDTISRYLLGIQEKKEHQAMREAFDGLMTYVTQHFKSEEEVMLNCKYAGYQSHKDEHDAFTARFNVLYQRFQNGEAVLPVELLRFMVNWLEEHLNGTDKLYTQFLAEKGVK